METFGRVIPRNNGHISVGIFSRFLVLISFFFAFSLILNSAFAQSCQEIFWQGSTQIQWAEKDIPPQALNLSPLKYRQIIREKMVKIFTGFELSSIPSGASFALNLSPKNRFHLVSHGLSSTQHEQLLRFILNQEIDKLLANIPLLFRNKYFEVGIKVDGFGRKIVEIKEKFPWEMSFPIQSQLTSGFALELRGGVRPYYPTPSSPEVKVRTKLLNQRISQDTLSTCGLASIVKVLDEHGIKYSENDLLQLTESLGIKAKDDIFGPNPGLELSQLAEVAEELGKKFSFSVTQVKISIPEEENDFGKAVKEVFQDENADIIVNYFSPAIGRPGGGHFTPVGGYNRKTNEVLMSEVNLVANPPFWVDQKTLLKGMASQGEGLNPRGYIVIKWY